MHQSTADGLNNMTRYLDAPAESIMGLMELATSSGPSLSGPVAKGSGELEAKRRKIRKGTRSCWECKRRKIRCVFDNAAEDALCFSCQRRGTTCVSQEFPEEEQSGGRARQMGDRIVRVEALVEQLVRTVGNSSGGDGSQGGATARSGSTGSGSAATGSPGAGAGAGAGPSSGERGASLGVLTPDDSGSESARLFGIYSTSVDGLEDEGLAASDANGTPFVRTLRESGIGYPQWAPPAGKFARISQMLHAALPSHEDALALCALGGGVAVYLKQLLSRPYDYLSNAGWDSPEMMAELPGPDVHPVLLAKKLLYFSILLQYSGTEFYATLQMSRAHGLTQLQAMARMVDIAINNVTTNDELIGSIDGLECVMLEGMFHGNWGNLRREWMTIRRAMVLAQLMGLHKGPENHQPLKVLDPTQRRIFPAHLWFRIVFADRYVSMMLGLPQGSLDRGMANEVLLANDTPMGRLERQECIIASRILERNESGASLTDSLAVTHQIDLELQRVAKVVPAKWWMVPALTEVMADPEAMFYATIRLMNQIFHYGMLIYLHLPYMLSFSPAGSQPHDSDGRGARASTSSAQSFRRTYSGAGQACHHHSKFEYSKVTCVNASRDVLSRYIAYRSVNHVAFCCRSVDFFALTASMALLLAHLDNHSARARAMQTAQQQQHALAAEDTAVDDIGVATGGEDGVQLNYSADFLGHSRFSDRGMMEQVLENMDNVSQASADVVSRKSAEVLRRLLEMESEAAEGTADGTGMGSSQHVHGQGNVDADFDADAEREDECDSGDPGRSTATSVEQGEGMLKMYIPYFGTIKIAKEGTLISKEAPKAVKTGTIADVDVPPLPQTPIAETRQQSLPRFQGFNNVSPPDQQRKQHSRQQERSGLNIDGLVHSNTATKNTFTVDIALELLSQNQQQQQLGRNLPQQSGRDTQLAGVEALPLTFSGTGLRSTSLVEDTVRQNMTYPGLTADINDWAFQGVDMAFFDSLMRGTAPGQQAESGGGAVGQQWW
ncbi:hypothetical protein CI102_13476 [Trichoderma harzianum]|nr:hypothetical protein CI102_13476 [Trichoderma harzianum]